MKQIFTLLFAGLLTMSSTGQHSGRNRHLLNDRQQHIRTTAPASTRNNPVETGRIRPLQSNTRIVKQEKAPLVLMQQMDSYVYQEYDAITSQWVNSSKDDFTYNASGYNTSEINYSWDPEAERYVENTRQSFTYENGNLIEQMYFEWDPVTSLWIQFSKITYAYDGAGNMTLSYSYFYDGSVWTLSSKDERTYNMNGNMTLQIISWWDDTGTQWINSSRTENTYNPNGSLSISTQSIWDFFTSEWEFSYKDEYAYNAGGFMITEISYTWNTGTSQWVNDYKYDYTYDDGNMNLTMVLENMWNGTQWVYSWKTELDYNNAFTFDELILPWFFMDAAVFFQHMITETLGYEYIDPSFMLSTKEEFFYSQVDITGIAVNEASHVSVYPQPANGQVAFRWTSNHPTLELAVYDANGKLVLSQQAGNNAAVSVDRLAPGLYYYTLSGKNQTVSSGKLSVR